MLDRFLCILATAGEEEYELISVYDIIMVPRQVP